MASSPSGLTELCSGKSGSRSRSPVASASAPGESAPGESAFIGSQGRGAHVARFPIPLSIRTCGFPAYGLPMIFLTWLRCLRIADGTAEPVQALSLEPLACPPVSLPGAQVPAPLLHHQALEPPRHMPVDLNELVSGVPGAEVVAPAAQQRVQVRDHLADILRPCAVAPGTGTDLLPEPFHRQLR